MKIRYVKIDDLLESCDKFKRDDNFINMVKEIKEVYDKKKNIKYIILSLEEYNSLNPEEYGEIKK